MINELQQQVSENLSKLDDMLDLMNYYSDSDADIDNLYAEYDKLFNQTLELSEKLN